MLNEIIKEIDEKQNEKTSMVLYDSIKNVIDDKYVGSDKNKVIELLCELRSYDRINDFAIPYSILAIGISIFSLIISIFSNIFNNNKCLICILWIIIVIAIIILFRIALKDYNINNKNLRYVKYIETIIKNKFDVK